MRIIDTIANISLHHISCVKIQTKHLRTWIPLLFALVCLTACKKTATEEKNNLIGVSIEPLRYFTEKIAGGGFKVASMVPSGYSPENYDPSPSQLMKMADCQVFFKVGNLGFENTWFQKVTKNYPDCRCFSLSDAIVSQPDDPHTWTSPRNARKFCLFICNELSKIDSVHASVFRQNTETLLHHIDSVDAQIRMILDSVANRTFVIAHPALSYFAQEYGLKQLSMETEGKETSVQDMQQLVLQCHEDKVQVILVQKEFNKAAAEALAKEIHAQTMEINPLNYEWDIEMTNIAKAIRDGGKK